jgi:hypothetical protein
MQSTYTGGTYGGLPTGYYIPNLHTVPPPYTVPPYAAQPLRPTPMPPQAQLPPPTMSQQQSPRHSLTVKEEELMQLALTMSLSEAAAKSSKAAATTPPQQGAPPMQRQPADRHAAHQRRHHRRAETLSGWDPVSLRCSGCRDRLGNGAFKKCPADFSTELAPMRCRDQTPRMIWSLLGPAQMRHWHALLGTCTMRSSRASSSWWSCRLPGSTGRRCSHGRGWPNHSTQARARSS